MRFTVGLLEAIMNTSDFWNLECCPIFGLLSSNFTKGPDTIRKTTGPILCHHCQCSGRSLPCRNFQYKNSSAAALPETNPCFPCDMLRHGWCHIAFVSVRVTISVPRPDADRGVRNAAAPLCVRPGEHPAISEIHEAPGHHLTVLASPTAGSSEARRPLSGIPETPRSLFTSRPDVRRQLCL